MSLDCENMCRLCLAPEDIGGDVVLSNIQQFLPLLDLFGLRQEDNMPQKICSTCQFQIESSQLLRKRVQYTNHLWMKFRNVPLESSLDMLMSCHICSQSFDVQSLVFHIRQVHGKDHLINCVFCKIFQENSTIEPIQADSIKEEDDPMMGIESEENQIYFPEETSFAAGLEPESEEEDQKIEQSVEDSSDDNDGDDNGDNDDDYYEEEETGSDSNASFNKLLNLQREPDPKIYECNVCFKNSNRSANIRRHFTIHGQFICNTCVSVYVTQEELDAHSQALPQDKALQCEQCPESSFKSSCDLRVHSRSHFLYKCTSSGCDKLFKSQSTLCKHIYRFHRKPKCIKCSKSLIILHDCNLCSFTSSTKAELRVHLESHNAQVCGHCLTGYTNGKEFNDHNSERSNSRNIYRCPYCAVIYKSFCEMKKHSRQHVDEMGTDQSDEIECTCGKPGPKTKPLTTASTSQKSTKPIFTVPIFDCNLCTRKLSTSYSILRHLQKYHGGDICKPCKTAYPKKEDYDSHVRERESGNPDKSYPCGECSQVFKSFCEQRAHGFKHLRYHKCRNCPERFETEKELQSHFLEAHKDEDTSVSCDLCGKWFKNIYERRQHVSIEHKSTIVMGMCEICGKYMPNSGINSHMTTHLTDTNFKCYFEGCSKAFTTSSALKNHIQRHSDERKYPCNFPGCGKRFKAPNTLRNHTVTHGNNKRHRCSMIGCDKAFHVKSDLQLHEKRHTGEKPFGCTSCGNVFYTNSLLRKHQQVCSNTTGKL